MIDLIWSLTHYTVSNGTEMNRNSTDLFQMTNPSCKYFLNMVSELRWEYLYVENLSKIIFWEYLYIENLSTSYFREASPQRMLLFCLTFNWRQVEHIGQFIMIYNFIKFLSWKKSKYSVVRNAFSTHTNISAVTKLL